MVLNHCTVCAVYESDQGDQKRIPVKCDLDWFFWQPDRVCQGVLRACCQEELWRVHTGAVACGLRDPGSDWDRRGAEEPAVRHGEGDGVYGFESGRIYRCHSKYWWGRNLFYHLDETAVRRYGWIFLLLCRDGVPDAGQHPAGRGIPGREIWLWMPVFGLSQGSGEGHQAVSSYEAVRTDLVKYSQREGDGYGYCETDHWSESE